MLNTYILRFIFDKISVVRILTQTLFTHSEIYNYNQYTDLSKPTDTLVLTNFVLTNDYLNSENILISEFLMIKMFFGKRNNSEEVIVQS